MEARLPDEQQASHFYGNAGKEADVTSQETNNEDTADEQQGVPRKKYHSSAMYAASMWHNTVKHVKPKHAGLNL